MVCAVLVSQSGGRLRVEGAQLRHHLGEILGIDAAHLHQPPHVPSRQQVQIVEQGRHRRVQPVALGKLRRQALLQVACEQPDRVELHHPLAHRLQPFQGHAQGRGDRRGLGGQPAGGAEQGHQVGGDQPLHRVVEGQAKLFGEVLAQRPAGIGHLLDAALAALEVASPAVAFDPARG